MSEIHQLPVPTRPSGPTEESWGCCPDCHHELARLSCATVQSGPHIDSLPKQVAVETTVDPMVVDLRDGNMRSSDEIEYELDWIQELIESLHPVKDAQELAELEVQFGEAVRELMLVHPETYVEVSKDVWTLRENLPGAAYKQ